ncbi:MAG: AIR synthase family protein [Thermomicrobium sp.]|uniref:AIR synthase family protein n=1 Tax=Thermomicrobium sp. TaxID=1969469 RepID=UPI001B060197|nr:AIR synthase family protein [Thermomicrobium sp.]MBO9352172.1 AIR synthase family protein [Thermomicrobium sp.]
MSDRPLPTGKLPPQLLAEFLGNLSPDPSVLLGPGIGHDAAVIQIDTIRLVFKSDPITFATEAIGWYALNVNANDVACLGARPRWFLATVLLPEGTTAHDAQVILDDLARAAERLGVSVVGGHTEITVGLDRPIVAGTMIGELTTEYVLSPARVRPGDALLLVRGIAIEGTALLARECRQTLERMLDQDLLARCRRFLYEPGISIVPAATLLLERLGEDLRYLHDPTEGGLATGLHEVAVACGTGLVVSEEAILVYPETRAVCTALGLDELGLIASGALLAVVTPESVERALDTLAQHDIPATQLGWLDPDPGRRVLIGSTGERPLPVFQVDEVARLFASGGCV